MNVRLTTIRHAIFAVLLLVAPSLAAEAQKLAKVYRIGFLAPQPQTYQEFFRDGLRELGYVNGRSVQIEYRFADGEEQRLPELAGQLAGLAVDVIVATNSSATRAAMQATKVIPIVMVTSGDPVGSGFIVSFARPGGNVTGLSSTALDTFEKQVQLLKDAFPKLSRAAMLCNPSNPANMAFLSKAPQVSQQVGLALERVDVRVPADLSPALDSVGSKQVGGVDRPAKPAELPVEQPTKYELVINLTTAKTLGLTIPDSVLLRADEIVE